MNMKISRFLLALALSAIAVALVSCSGSSGQRHTLKIGVVLPLTGPAADQGKDILRGMEMAKDEINSAEDPLELTLAVEDDQSTPNGAVAALKKLLETARPPVVIGPIASSNMLAMIPVAERAKVVLLSPAASSPKISNSGKYIFRISLLAPAQTKVLADYAASNLKAKAAAILYVNDDTGISYRDAFTKDFSRLGGRVVCAESYDKKATDFRAQLTKVKAASPRVVFAPGIPQTIGLVLKQAREMGIKASFLGNYGAEGESLLAGAGTAAEGFVYSSIPVRREFVESYTGKFKAAPTIGAPLGYDATRIVAHLALRSGASSANIRNGLSHLRNYGGATGRTTILPSGDADKDVCLKTVRRGAFALLAE